jgi:hypothetical protein
MHSFQQSFLAQQAERGGQTEPQAILSQLAVEPDYLVTSWEWNWWFVQVMIFWILTLVAIVVLMVTLISIARSLKVIADTYRSQDRYGGTRHGVQDDSLDTH